MGFISEFKAFAMRGNVVDMAIGVVIGAAFGKIVGALVEKVFMPVVALATKGVDFSKAGAVIREGVVGADGKVLQPAVEIGYGAVIQAVIDFIIIAFVLFMVIKAMNKAMPKPPAPPPPGPTADQKLLTEIRDLLAKRG